NDRIFGIDRLRRRLALRQPHAPSAPQINGWDDNHGSVTWNIVWIGYDMTLTLHTSPALFGCDCSPELLLLTDTARRSQSDLRRSRMRKYYSFRPNNQAQNSSGRVREKTGRTLHCCPPSPLACGCSTRLALTKSPDIEVTIGPTHRETDEAEPVIRA